MLRLARDVLCVVVGRIAAEFTTFLQCHRNKTERKYLMALSLSTISCSSNLIISGSPNHLGNSVFDDRIKIILIKDNLITRVGGGNIDPRAFIKGRQIRYSWIQELY